MQQNGAIQKKKAKLDIIIMQIWAYLRPASLK